ncbi:MAG: BACON domain-containing protein [Prevotella sp.]|nr:BACON domain-containing protein [Prevotella sp.]
MNKVKIWTLAVLVALGLTACSNQDNTYREPYVNYAEEVALPSAAGTYTVTLNSIRGTGQISQISDDWATATPVTVDATSNTQIEVTLTENYYGEPRTVTMKVMANPSTVNLTIVQGITDIRDPNEEVTDQPAYAPGK